MDADESAKRTKESAVDSRRTDVVYERSRAVRRLLEGIFPFLVESGRPVYFHPNADNQSLKKYGIGYEDATLDDHLALGNSLEIDFPKRFPSLASSGSGRRDHEVFSITTLLQAHCFRAALLEQDVTVGVLEGGYDFLHHGFAPSVPNVIVGSPTGNYLAAFMHGKVRRRELERKRELEHEGVAGLHLPFEFSLDADADPSVGSEKAGYQWSLYKASAGGRRLRSFVPKPEESDYFTVSVLPSHFAHGFDLRTIPPVTLLEGCTALGTSGIKLLFSEFAARAGRPLADLANRVRRGRSKYWQALFKISGVKPKRRSIVSLERFRNVKSEADEIEFVDFEWVFPENDLLKHAPLVGKALEEACTKLGKHR